MVMEGTLLVEDTSAFFLAQTLLMLSLQVNYNQQKLQLFIFLNNIIKILYNKLSCAVVDKGVFLLYLCYQEIMGQLMGKVNFGGNNFTRKS